ncbi:MAG TPA: hypothetical protein VN919_01385 [Xanthobacteraceae bacterium]|nr:hypothetical protein [Xanthobacteraceae bacterium]
MGIDRKFLVKKSLTLYSSLALAAALLFTASAAALSSNVYSSVAGNYSVSFPSPPQENVQTTPAYRIVTHVVKDNDVIYIVAHGDFEVALQADLELDANMDNYVKELHATVASRGPLTFGRGDKTLPAKQFTYQSERLTGKGIVVVDGKSSYLAAATAVKPDNHDVAVNAFVSSFTLAPAK